MAKKYSFLASRNPQAQEAKAQHIKHYGQCTPEEADYLVVLGGDGFMLYALHHYGHLSKPFYGINFGTIGFLMNESLEIALLKDEINAAQEIRIHPLKATMEDSLGQVHAVFAYNEIALLRHSALAATIRILVDQVVRMEMLVCDGILVSTPMGSSAYNFSAHGPILPLGAPLLALTPLSPFRPRRWRGALLPNMAQIRFEILDAALRPVNASADAQLIPDVRNIGVVQDFTRSCCLLFKPGHNLEDRLLQEQFAP